MLLPLHVPTMNLLDKNLLTTPRCPPGLLLVLVWVQRPVSCVRFLFLEKSQRGAAQT